MTEQDVKLAPDRDAPADHDIHALLRARWSPRAFQERSISRDAISSLLEAARWAASCSNEQPWVFLVAHREDEEEFAKMLDCVKPSNQVWVRRASALMVTVARRSFASDGEHNPVALYDLGQAAANMALQAVAMGLQIHQMRGADFDRLRVLYGVPADYEPVSAIAVGYADDPAILPPKLFQREIAPRSRRQIGEFTFRGHWGRSMFKSDAN